MLTTTLLILSAIPLQAEDAELARKAQEVHVDEEVAHHLERGGPRLLGDRAEHCWNGDHENGNHISRLRYHRMFIKKYVEKVANVAPKGADLKSWRY